MGADQDCIVIGAGVVGCAVACALARAGHDVWVLEAAAREGTGLSSRNSGVLHAGLWYPTRFLRRRACVRGRALAVELCRSAGVPHRITGKFVVAHEEAEMDALATIAAEAEAAGVSGVSIVGGADVVRAEPALRRPRAALRVEDTGIVDPVAFTAALRARAERAGALFLFQTRVRALAPAPGGVAVESDRGRVVAARLVNAAGLSAGRLAGMLVPGAPPMHPCRGDYFRLRRPPGIARPVYPVRRKGSPGLGLHLTPDLAGGVRVGPDARFVPEAGNDPKPPPDLGRRFAAAARRLLAAEVTEADLAYDGYGIRPKLRAPGDPDERDFLLLCGPSAALHFLGIESPGLTAALALAEAAVAWARGDSNGPWTTLAPP